MDTIVDIDVLNTKILECNDVLTCQGDEAMRRFFQTFRGDFSGQAPADPFSEEYRDFQVRLHERICGRPYSPKNERTHFDLAAYRDRPYPYYLESLPTAGEYLLAIAFMVRMMDLPPNARVLEFGPGWGETTITLALLGVQVTAVDIEPNFCEMLCHRAAQNRVDIEVVEADFFWAESVTEPYDAVLFFESFHHCHDHLRLLRALQTAVKPEGQIIFGAEPIVPGYNIPWGISMDGHALWSMRNFGWLELGFNEEYFKAALSRTGWSAEKHKSGDVPFATAWRARRLAPELADAAMAEQPCPWQEPVATQEPPTAQPAEIGERMHEAVGMPAPSPRELQLERELAAMRESTSWRLTAPIRGLRRLLG
ncbi:class I SAM-dependent methyltransferase [Lichenicoccus sp.]|uniref:class I SAM-dependent methyltransferase n=1 Tax=Lichenicoccus sp. TaxID=2781899 RepID=UPI003D1467CF